MKGTLGFLPSQGELPSSMVLAMRSKCEWEVEDISKVWHMQLFYGLTWARVQPS